LNPNLNKNKLYQMKTKVGEIDVRALEKPSDKLLTYYFFASLLSGPAIVIVFPALLIRFNTLRYRFEESGIRMIVGLFFRKEVVVAFRRIQDIHVSRNLIQRWLGIATISIQTASGNAAPEIVIEGVLDADLVRDWLYERMRGAKGVTDQRHATDGIVLSDDDKKSEQISALLTGIRDNLAILANRSLPTERQGTDQSDPGQAT
jgi:uncharacterized protein